MPKSYTEADCLRIIDLGAENAYDLLTAEMPGVERRFRRVDKAIRDLLTEVQQVFPDACYYTASGGFNLMLGNPHAVGRDMTSQQQLVALRGRARISDGDF